MEQEAAGSDNEVADEGDEEDGVVAIFETVRYSAKGQNHKEEVGQGIDYLGRVNGGIVVLIRRQSRPGNANQAPKLTSSHQLSVLVTGSQYPFFNGGYGTEGSHEGMLAADGSRRAELEPAQRICKIRGC